MKLRAKKGVEKAEEAPPEPEAPADPGPNRMDQAVAEKLAPLEEARQKTDQWMKETSAQLARISGHVQQDEKRQESLDRRLADFEDRIQGMLQLTEALSMNDNPFVRPRGEKSTHAQAKPEEDEAPPLEPVVVPVGRDEPEGEPHVEEHIAPAPTRTDDRTPEREPITLMDETVRARPRASHPNDATRESGAPPAPRDEDDELQAILIAEPEDNPFLMSNAEPEPYDEPFAGAAPTPPEPLSAPLGADAAGLARRRLTLLQWAALLAKHLGRFDLDDFLETYTRTAWIDNRDAADVRALATDLARHGRMDDKRLSREELHVRTILILSALQSGARTEPQRAARMVEEARDLANAPWLPPDS